MAKRQPFIFYIIAEPNGEHTPCLMSANGKKPLNERCKRWQSIHKTWVNLCAWINDPDHKTDVATFHISRKMFNAKYPKGPAKNSGPKPTTKKKKA